MNNDTITDTARHEAFNAVLRRKLDHIKHSRTIHDELERGYALVEEFAKTLTPEDRKALATVIN